MIYTLTVDAPRWSRSRPIAWVARVLRADRRWAAHGRSQSEFESDILRLSARAGGFDVKFQCDPWSVSVTTSEGHESVVEMSCIPRRERPIMSSRANTAFSVLLGLVVAVVVGFDAWVDADWSSILDALGLLMVGAGGYMIGMGHRARETSKP